MSRALDGTNPVAYLGVRPLTPPNMIIPGNKPYSNPRDPTQNDIQYNLGDHWLNTATQGLWYLAFLGSHLVSGINTRYAVWLQFGLGNGTVKTLTGDTGGPVGPDINGNINTLGTANNITVTGNPGTNTLTWNVGSHIAAAYPTDLGTAVPLANSLNIITNNAANNAGSSVLFTGVGNTVTWNVTDASNNTLVGSLAGNLTLTGTNNTGLGKSVLHALTSGTFNTAVGSGLALGALTSGTLNTAVGYQALDGITTGGHNVALGAGAGNAYTTSESSNIIVGNAGVISESNIIRIGTQGGGAGQQNKAFMAGIHGVTPVGGSILSVVIDSNGQLGTEGGVAFTSINIQVFTGSGTYTPTANMKYCIVEIVGGGGGGGATGASGGTNVGTGGGGSGGGYARSAYSAATIGVSQAVTIGAGGAGGALGANDGTPGGTTSFGALMTATGGNGGNHGDQLNPISTGSGGNVPGSGSGGTFNSTGAPGTGGFGWTNGTWYLTVPGVGGASILGGGGGAFPGASMAGGQGAGGDAGGYGGAGGGASSSAGGIGARGGNGVAGVCIVTEFI